MTEKREGLYTRPSPTKAPLEIQVQRHLNEPRASQSISDEPDIRGRRAVTRNGVEARIQRYVILGSVEAGMVEQVEEVSLVLQLEALRNFEVFLHREIESILERRAEKVPPVRSETCFEVVARRRSGAVSWLQHRWPARRHSHLPRRQQRNREVPRIEVLLASVDSGRSLRLRLFWRHSRRQWKYRVRDKIVRAIEDACHRSRKIVNRKRLPAFQNRHAGNRPTVHDIVRESLRPPGLRELIHIVDLDHVRAIKVSRGIARFLIQWIVPVVDEPETALLIESMRPSI